jgi:prolyl oligopeptidase
MQPAIEHPPYSRVEPVTDVVHGVPVVDPYRWLEDQESLETRRWLAEQSCYARSYLDAVPGREIIRERIREFLDVETFDCLQAVGNRYVFRKRLRGQEQPGIYLREGADAEDQLLLDPAKRETGSYTALCPLQVSVDGRLLLYEVKQGGERAGTFELFDIEKRRTLPDTLPRGFLRGFAFAPDLRSFYYVHEAIGSEAPCIHAVYHHILGADFADDEEVFSVGESRELQLQIAPGEKDLGFLVYRIADHIYTDFYLWRLDGSDRPQQLIKNAAYRFVPRLLRGRLLALTDRDAPTCRIVEVHGQSEREPEFSDIVPACEAPIRNWIVTQNMIYVAYVKGTTTQIRVFDLSGRSLGCVPSRQHCTIRMVGAAMDADELFFEQESFTNPIQIYCYSPRRGAAKLWAQRSAPFDSARFQHLQVSYTAKDGTTVPMFLVGLREILEGGRHPVIMTSYGGYGVPMTPQFSVFVAFLMEHGCLFALPNIRGGSEFGAEWHTSAKRRNRQVAIDDFLAAAEWLIETGRAEPKRLAIFGGSNAGLLVGAAVTQRPELFRAVVCMVPILDMLRYHLFDNARLWKDEFGSADDPADFAALAEYSPYHRVRNGVAYPAVMIVSGDSDQNCNPLHARKMTARLQAANVSQNPIVLDYSESRGHAPVLPLSTRIDALTDRMAFLCDQLGLSI